MDNNEFNGNMEENKTASNQMAQNQENATGNANADGDSNTNESYTAAPDQNEHNNEQPSNGADKTKTLAIASLVLGIISIAFAWLFYISIICLVCGIVGVVLAVKSRKESPSAIATAGMVTSIIGICCSGVFFACSVTAAAGLACASAVSHLT